MAEEIISGQTGYQVYETGIEQDEENEPEMDPFDPEEISIDSKVLAMETLLRRLIQGTILLNPDFQRNEVWTHEKKSQLIESLMLKIPLPMFYVSADEKNNFTVVDGLQRLSTIRSFIIGDDYLKLIENVDKDALPNTYESKRGEGFKLQNLEFWKLYEGKNFNDLPNNIRNRILESEFRFTVINPGTPEEVRRNIFKRLNTGGMALSSQEIRNALYLGYATRLLKDLSTNPQFLKATDFSIKSLRMEDKELILRFLSFLIRDYKTYKRSMSIDTYLSDTMIILNSFPSLNTRDFIKTQKNRNFETSDITVISDIEIKQKFKTAMERVFLIFGRHSFRKSYGNNRRTAINKALFETWGVLMSSLTEKEFKILEKNKTAFLRDYIPIITNSSFQTVISRDSMKNTSVKLRFEQFNELIKKYIND